MVHTKTTPVMIVNPIHRDILRNRKSTTDIKINLAIRCNVKKSLEILLFQTHGHSLSCLYMFFLNYESIKTLWQSTCYIMSGWIGLVLRRNSSFHVVTCIVTLSLLNVITVSRWVPKIYSNMCIMLWSILLIFVTVVCFLSLFSGYHYFISYWATTSQTNIVKRHQICIP